MVSLPMTKTAFVAIQDMYIASVATTAGVVRENVKILSIDEVSTRSSVIITGRSLLTSSVRIQTSVLIPVGQQTSIQDQSLLNNNLNKNGLPSGTLVVQSTYTSTANTTVLTPGGSGASGTEVASVSGAASLPIAAIVGGAVGFSALVAFTLLAFRYTRNHMARPLPALSFTLPACPLITNPSYTTCKMLVGSLKYCYVLLVVCFAVCLLFDLLSLLWRNVIGMNACLCIVFNKASCLSVWLVYKRAWHHLFSCIDFLSMLCLAETVKPQGGKFQSFNCLYWSPGVFGCFLQVYCCTLYSFESLPLNFLCAEACLCYSFQFNLLCVCWRQVEQPKIRPIRHAVDILEVPQYKPLRLTESFKPSKTCREYVEQDCAEALPAFRQYCQGLVECGCEVSWPLCLLCPAFL